MDKHLKGSKKNSILKSQKTEVDGGKATSGDDQNAHERRVSFHSLKTVQKFEESHLNLLDGSPFEVRIEETTSSSGVPTKFEESHLNLLDGSPFEVKIEETTSSSGVPTYDKSHMPSTTPMVTDEMETSFVNSAVIISDGKVLELISYGFGFREMGEIRIFTFEAVLGTSYIGRNKTRDNNDETMLVLNVQRQEPTYPINAQYFRFPRDECDMDISLTNSVCSHSDCTINLFGRMSSGDVSDVNVTATAPSLEKAENACEILCNRYNDGEWKGDDNGGENNNSRSLEGGETEIRNLSAVCATRNLNQDSFDMNIHEIDNVTELDCSVENSHNESSIIKRNISIMQGGGRFRISSSPSSKTFSIQSFLNDSVRFRNKMMFNTHSLQLGSDYRELVYRARFRAEIEWAQIRLQISREYRSKLEIMKLFTYNDEAVLKTIQKNVQLCNSINELQKDVEALQTELNALPNTEEIAEKIDRHKQAVQEEKDLDRQILDLEIEELRLELQLARVKNKEFRKQVACLNKFADAYEENNTRVNELVRQVLSDDQSE
ncbi:hypothetical protein DICVIV_13006 [Dictyocaulus viviparus]|uniref:Uncharacterized protein n=1 Tax=Dictyocaulus viviparus TaxID=29172 RepID=A0A0D8XBJ9_DICVI|nr:hypothetical protein DICVIV_13006 [Dictyocaulus viviparus]